MRRSRAVPGKPDPANAAAVTEAIEIAVKACLDGEAAALVTAPIHKAVLNAAGFAFPGHTEFLAHLTGARRAVMMLASDKLRVVPLTIHMPLAEVPEAIDQAGGVRHRRNHPDRAAPRFRHSAIRAWRWRGSIPMPAKTACWAAKRKRSSRPPSRR